jgi:hypothetical protein
MKTKVNTKKKVSTDPKSEPLKQGDVISSVCEIPNCNKTEYRIGWCKNHYNLLCRNKAN